MHGNYLKDRWKIAYDGKDYSFDRFVRVEANGRKPDAFLYGKRGSGDISRNKIHVGLGDTADPSLDLKKLQDVLIPRLMEDPELKGLIHTWKTINPGFGRGSKSDNLSDFLEPATTDQGAKAFTIYTATERDAVEVAKKIDKILKDNNLGFDKRIDPGNVDRILPGSNRVGIVRDHWKAGDADILKPYENRHFAAVRLEPELASSIKKIYNLDGLSTQQRDAQLRAIERELGIKDQQLLFDKKGDLAIRAQIKPNESVFPGEKIYVAEGAKPPAKLTDRQAIYRLAEKANLIVDELS